MNVCDDSLRLLAQNIGSLELQYSPHFAWLLQPPVPARSHLTLLEKVSGACLNDPARPIKKVPDDSLAAKLKSTPMLELDHRKDRKYLGRHVYYAKCACGGVVFLVAEELLALDRLNAGCLQTGCSATPARVKMWYHPKTAAALQITQLETLFPQRVPPEWRGMQVGDAADTLLGLRNEQRSAGAGQWWFQNLPGISVTGKQPALSNKSSVLCTKVPDPRLFPKGEVVVNVEGEIMTTSEVATAFSVEEDVVINMKSQYWDADLTNELLEVHSANRY